jgi:hypothetical protein
MKKKCMMDRKNVRNLQDFNFSQVTNVAVPSQDSSIVIATTTMTASSTKQTTTHTHTHFLTLSLYHTHRLTFASVQTLHLPQRHTRIPRQMRQNDRSRHGHGQIEARVPLLVWHAGWVAWWGGGCSACACA